MPMSIFKKIAGMDTLHFIQLIRLNQWIKNICVLLPLFFLKTIPSIEEVLTLLLATFLFGLASSSVYIVNDLHDVKADKNHPLKSKTRPLASEVISKSQALSCLFILYAVLFIFFLIQFEVMLIITSYILLNYAYTFCLKDIFVVDALCVALGFILRFYAGVIVLGAVISLWVYGALFFLMLYIIFMKREQELILSTYKSRESLKNYNQKLITILSYCSAIAAVICYLFYAWVTNIYLIVIVPLFVFWIYRFHHVSSMVLSSDCPTTTFSKDFFLKLISLISLILQILIIQLA